MQQEAPARSERRLPWALEFYRSDVGKKWVMAVSGIVLLGFILVHMIGNLHLYEGEVRLNEYSEGLRDIGEPLVPRSLLLWSVRLVLIGAFALHIHAAYALALKNRRAPADRYQSQRDYIAANFASRTMVWTGTIVLLFLIYHLAHLTWGIDAVHSEFVRGEVYDNVVSGFENPAISAFYILANLALGYHIYHGAWSLFQSLGINSPRFNPWRKGFASSFAAVIVIGNLSFPLMVLIGVVD